MALSEESVTNFKGTVRDALGELRKNCQAMGETKNVVPMDLLKVHAEKVGVVQAAALELQKQEENNLAIRCIVDLSTRASALAEVLLKSHNVHVVHLTTAFWQEVDLLIETTLQRVAHPERVEPVIRCFGKALGERMRWLTEDILA